MKSTKEQIIEKTYVGVTHIQTLFDYGRPKALKLFNIVSQIEDEELGEWRLDRTKVRLSKVLKVQGINYQMLRRQIKSNA